MSTPNMTYSEAKHFPLSFGRYKHLPVTARTLDEIAKLSEGLEYLVYLRRSLHKHGCKDWQMRTRDALDVYLDNRAKDVQPNAPVVPVANLDRRVIRGTHAENQRALEYGL